MEEKSLQRMLTVAGLIMVLAGGLIIWKAVTDVIPSLNLYYGSFFIFGGAVIGILGLLLLIVPPLKRKKKAKKEEGTS